eukprot:6742731-Prorocentrum_lima.AAC.1
MDFSQLDITMLFPTVSLFLCSLCSPSPTISTLDLFHHRLPWRGQPTHLLLYLFFNLAPPEPSLGRFPRGRCAPARQGAQA